MKNIKPIFEPIFYKAPSSDFNYGRKKKIWKKLSIHHRAWARFAEKQTRVSQNYSFIKLIISSPDYLPSFIYTFMKCVQNLRNLVVHQRRRSRRIHRLVWYDYFIETLTWIFICIFIVARTLVFNSIISFNKFIDSVPRATRVNFTIRFLQLRETNLFIHTARYYFSVMVYRGRVPAIIQLEIILIMKKILMQNLRPTVSLFTPFSIKLNSRTTC